MLAPAPPSGLRCDGAAQLARLHNVTALEWTGFRLTHIARRSVAERSTNRASVQPYDRIDDWFGAVEPPFPKAVWGFIKNAAAAGA